MNEDELLRDLAGLRDGAAPGDLVERLVADAALEAARRDRPRPSDLLMARIAADAGRVARRRRQQGWGALGGLALASAAGLVIGMADPGGLIAGALPGEPAYDQLGGAYEFQMAELAP